MPSIAASLVPELLVRYKQDYPEVSLRILEAYSGSLMDWLAAGRVDFAVVNNTGLLSGVAVLPLVRDYLVLVTRRSKGAAASVPAHHLRDYRLVLPSQRQGMRVLLDSMLASHGIVLKPEIELDSLAPTIDLVRNSDWATVLPIVAVKRAADARQLAARKIVDPVLPREIVVAHNANRPPSVAGQHFLRLLKQEAEALLRSA
jgi:DNA-binding transcriptional LysR family regulator